MFPDVPPSQLAGAAVDFVPKSDPVIIKVSPSDTVPDVSEIDGVFPYDVAVKKIRKSITVNRIHFTEG
jgi:hypothetical protein